jgi:carboxypeptidase family protein
LAVNKLKAQILSNPRLSAVVLVLLMGCLAALPCSAQSAANLYGTVTDAGGAAIPGASVTVTDVGTSVVTKTTTDGSGNYSFPSLAPAGYSITVESPGFKTEVLTGIVLLVDQKARVDVHLQVGSVDTKVEVTGEAPLVDTSSASVGTVIGTRETVDLPLNVRRFGALATLVPGTVPDAQGGTTGAGFANNAIGSPFSEETYAANGARSSSNNTLIDGADSRNLSFGGFAVQPSPDAVQEFKIQTNIYDAAFGKTAGSTINLVTKSGSNEFHGSVYDFLRNDALDASNYFNPVKPEQRRNQYGASLGGPIIRSKHLFFFANYEGLRQIQGQSALTIVPTDAEKAGNMSNLLTGKTGNLCGTGGPANYNYDTGQIFNPGTETTVTCPSGTLQGKTILVGTPVPGNIITTIDPVAQHVFSLGAFPEPNIVSSSGNNYINSAPLTRDDDQADARVDWDKSEKNQIFARYILGQANIVQNTGYSTLPSFGDTLYFRGQNVAIGWTHTFGPRILNEALFGFQRDTNIENCASCPRPAGFVEAFGIQGLAPLQPSLAGFPIFGFSNGTSTIGDSNYRPVISPDMIEKYQDTVTITKGRHTLVAGADIQPYQVLGEEAAYSPHGELDFNGQYSAVAGELNGGTSTGSDFADFLQGYPDAGNRTLKFEGNNQVGGMFNSLFFQDNVKLSPNLSINAGIRWEYRRPSIDKNNNYVTLVPTGAKFTGAGNALLVTAAPAAQNDAFCPNAPDAYLTSNSGECLIASSTQRTALGFSGRTVRTLIHPVYHDFAPRFGIVGRPTGSDKLVVRAGYGIFYDLPNFNNQHFVDNNPVFSPSQQLVTTQGNAPIATSPTIFSGAGAGIPKLTNQFVSLYVEPHYLAPYFQQWSFGIQSQLSPNWAIDLAYIGTRGLKEGNLHLAGNQAEPGTTALQSRRPYIDFGTMLYTTSDGVSNYNALQFKITKRLSQGLSMTGAYTWAKSLDDAEGDEGFGAGANDSNLAQDDNNLPFEYSRAYDDARHRVVVNAVYDLPFGHGRQFLNSGGILSYVVGGWEASGITSVQTGYPFVVLGPDFSNTGSDSPRPNRICTGIGEKAVTNWFNSSCFVAAGSTANPSFGDSRRNILDGPGLVNTDMTVMRHFNMWDKADVVFRGEFFNAFNHPYFGAPTNNINNPTTVGRITSASDGRQIQLALKILF